MGTDLMTNIREELCRDMPRALVTTWFSDVSVVSADEQVLTICSPIEYKREMIRNRYLRALSDAATAVTGQTCEVRLVGGDDLPEPEPDTPARADGEWRGRREFAFENFIVGESNKYAYSASLAVADSPGSATHNPLFLYGGSGLGKTHLLLAINNRICKKRPDFRILVFSAEQFTNDLVNALQNKKTIDFRERYRSADLLLVDDIQFIAGRDFSQEEFFHTFNTLFDDNKQIVLTSDRPPRDLQKLEERLRTRFEGGLLIDINPPDFETRMAIVKSKALSLGMILPVDVTVYLAETITSNVRQLEGAVKKLMATRNLMRADIDLKAAQEAVADMIRENPGLNPTPQLIMRAVCDFYRLDERQITGKGRQAHLVTARQTAMFLFRDMTNLSLEQIGERHFSRDHTTVMHSIQRVEDRRREDTAYDSEVKTIIENIRGV
ncbi:MAG: chromosomal replication initiator protein DnaA [Oscillospiraceae bacterium]|jgi:chromosomal replication initiator protein|nr:chromosomal replication initiator protein DnaA [Oscillospiraceae bacterium]